MKKSLALAAIVASTGALASITSIPVQAASVPSLPGVSHPVPHGKVQKEALSVFDSIRFTDRHGYRTFRSPIFTKESGWELAIGMAPMKTRKAVPVQYSLNNGRTWHTAPSNYDSFDPGQGGVTIVPHGVKTVLVRGPVKDMAGIAFAQIGMRSSMPVANMYVLPNGSRKIVLISEGVR